ncbi:unnamed protein product [Chrysodeixis includens]|uniref:Uncharacterized protein n=1 Tax=Chrysodeixis includens TaxID=689277 RepID=A0A9P0BRC6_CHRIL|nr:unnamed protein product [Chrysodeixis includens]
MNKILIYIIDILTFEHYLYSSSINLNKILIYIIDILTFEHYLYSSSINMNKILNYIVMYFNLLPYVNSNMTYPYNDGTGLLTTTCKLYNLIQLIN